MKLFFKKLSIRKGDKRGEQVDLREESETLDDAIDKFSEVETASKESPSINPTHNRVPIENTRNLNDWKKGYDEGKPDWNKGELPPTEGNLEKAIKLFDKARFNGYDVPALYRSYALAYRKLKDYGNEIAIIDEAVERTGSEGATTIN